MWMGLCASMSCEEAVDELLALEVADLPQRHATAEVFIAVRVAARTSAADIRG